MSAEESRDEHLLLCFSILFDNIIALIICAFNNTRDIVFIYRERVFCLLQNFATRKYSMSTLHKLGMEPSRASTYILFATSGFRKYKKKKERKK